MSKKRMFLILSMVSFSSHLTAEVSSVEMQETETVDVIKSPAKWYEKSFEEILNSKIVTATRGPSSRQDAPGVVTVFSRQDIERMGLRSVKEVLERTTGFFVNRQFSGAVVGSRGFIADNDQFLMLIDGHNMNSIFDKGMGAEFLMPGLEHVERIEIVRGPGSTLWGSDAALGIIHIITKDGAAIDGLKITANKSYEDNASHLNILAGEAITDEVDLMASLTLSESDGFPMQGMGLERGSLEPWTEHWDNIQNSFQFYSKVRVKNFHLKARASQSNISRAYNPSQLSSDDAFRQRNHYYVDAAYIKDVKPGITVEARVFADFMDRTQLLVTPEYTPTVQRVQNSESSEELKLGFELISRWKDIANHNFLVGYKQESTDISAFTLVEQYDVTTTDSSAKPVSDKLVVPMSNDENKSFFIEDEWRVIPGKLKLLLGVRVDKNTLREDNTIILPRFDLNWTPTSQWQIKYSYNTGYIRPPVAVGFLGQTQAFQSDVLFEDNTGLHYMQGASESQEVYSHDLQFNYTVGRVQSHVNFYHTTIEKPFQLLFEPNSVNGKEFINYYANTDDITSYGVELGWTVLLSNEWQLYGDISKVLSSEISSMTGSSGALEYDLNNTLYNFGEGSFTPSGTMTGFPHLMLNLGLNWDVNPNILSNLHLRFWDQMSGRIQTEETKSEGISGDFIETEYGPEFFVDYNILFKQVLGSSMDASLYVKNLLDNDDSEIHMLAFNNAWSDRGRTMGASLSYQF
ncbi:MAG: TonB-dependent receptor [Pseudomonadales bacterium]|nr:TonB-dependent receptor [Pseudomonadales bacterium]